MFRLALNRFYQFSSKGQKQARQTLDKMAEQLEKMKQTMDKTTPRVFALILIGSALPTIYYINQLIERPFNDPEYTDSANRAIKYYYFRNLVMYSCVLALYQSRYFNPSSKFTVPRMPVKMIMAPLLLSLIGMALPPSDSKHMVWGVLVTDILTMVKEVEITNQAIIPFWLYSFKHYIRFFDWLTLIILFFALKRHQSRRLSHPHEFAQEIQSP